MNCRQARSLFSTRVDGELRASDTARLRRHLAECNGCAARWGSFETTVRWLRTLPPVAPDPSFVGQVLDRVRAYEVDRASGAVDVLGVRLGLGARVRALLPELGWPRIVLPVRLGAALALGLVVGFVAANHDQWTGPGSMARISVAARSLSTGPASPAAGAPEGLRSLHGVPGSGSAEGPFGDLVQKFGLNRPSAAPADSASKDSGLPQQPMVLPNDPQGLGRPVQLDQPDGRLQITF